jgi:hypothetical protein
MSLVSSTIPNLVNGVSQQPFALRLSSQAEVQVNGDSSVVEGLKKRPPTKHRAKILSSPLTNAFIHTINRDDTERYVAIFQNGSVRVFDTAGVERTVSYPGGTSSYLATTKPDEDFRVVSVADFNFVLNRSITVANDTVDLTPARFPEAMVWIRQGAYSAEYKITLDGFGTVSYKSSDGSVAAHSETVRTDLIAADLAGKINTNWPGTFDANAYGSVIHIYRDNFTDFGISVSDSLGDQAVRLAKGAVQRFSDLPAKAIPGFRVQIRGTSENAFDDYYIEYEAAPNQFGGVWKECAKGSERRAFNAATMPHALVRVAGGNFELRRLDWKKRLVGDLDSNPFPTFVGKKLNDLFFHRNRLGILADENVVFTKASDTFDFFRESAIQLVDSDSIDVAVSHVKVSILRHAVPFNETLILFSDQTQFQLGKSDILAPKTVTLQQTTEFECSLRTKPIGIGNNVYFVQDRGKFSGVREYYVDGDTQINDAADVTSHVPKYLPSNIFKLTGSTTEDIIVAFSKDSPNKMYVYRYYWSNNEKLQSSWSHWELSSGTTILNGDFIESELWLVVSRADGVYLESISIEPGYTEAGSDLPCLFDRLVAPAQCVVSYNAGTNETTVTLPLTVTNSGAGWALVEWPRGNLIPFTLVTATSIRFKGNIANFRFGLRYNFLYKFSQLVVRDQAPGGGQMAIMSGRVQVRRMKLTHSDSGYFKAVVTAFQRPTTDYIFTGRAIGDASSLLGSPAINSRSFTFPVNARNDQVAIELQSDSHMPCAFLSADWEAMYVIRSRRI